MKGLKGTELEETLNGYGPFTILAPVNLAFSNLATSAFEELVKTGAHEKLTAILGNHVLKEKRMHRDFRNGLKLKTINGKEISVTVENGEVRINGAKILSRDRQGSNGVVHSIDSVDILS